MGFSLECKYDFTDSLRQVKQALQQFFKKSEHWTCFLSLLREKLEAMNFLSYVALASITIYSYSFAILWWELLNYTPQHFKHCYHTVHKIHNLKYNPGPCMIWPLLTSLLLSQISLLLSSLFSAILVCFRFLNKTRHFLSQVHCACFCRGIKFLSWSLPLDQNLNITSLDFPRPSPLTTLNCKSEFLS